MVKDSFPDRKRVVVVVVNQRVGSTPRRRIVFTPDESKLIKTDSGSPPVLVSDKQARAGRVIAGLGLRVVFFFFGEKS